MKKALAAASLLLLVLGGFIAWFVYKIKQTTYDYKIEKYSIAGIDIAKKRATLNLIISLAIKSAVPFNIKVSSLYYEIYYADNLIGKSANTNGFTINKSPMETNISQSVNAYIDESSIQIARNYLSKTPTEYLVKIYVKVFGVSIGLSNLKFTY